MNLLILGYGKMGKIISTIAESRGHHIAAKINIENRADLEQLDPKIIDCAIEFSQPEAAIRATILTDRSWPKPVSEI